MQFLVLLTVMFTAGCDKPAASPTTPPPPVAVPQATTAGHLNQAQPKLKTLKLWLGAQEVQAELALTDVQRMTGMMFRTNMNDGEAMLFVFPFPHRTGFYMKNTLVPLSAAYIDPKGTILEIHDLQPKNLTPVDADSDQIQFVLEVPLGWFKRNGVNVGAVITSEQGSLTETFFKRR